MNFGKCHQYLDPKNSTSGLQCKCFMFRATENGKYLCACCGHDRNYHEPPSQHFDSTNRTSIPTSIQSSIAAQEPDELDVENFEINVEELNTRVRVDRKNVFKVINLFNVGPKPKIPRGIKKFKKKGIMNSIQFSEDSSNGIKSVIEAAFPWLKNRNWVFFRCDSTSVLVVADIPAKGWNIKALTKISGCRKKLYIGVVSSSSVELVDESNIIIDQGSSTSASTSSSSQPVPTDRGAFTMPYTGINAPTNFIDQGSSTSATIMPYTGINASQIQSHPTENFQPITNYQQTEIFQANYQSATNLESNLFDAYQIMNLNHHRT